MLHKCHDDVLSGHGGFSKILDRIKRQYYWPRMELDVKEYVNNCLICKAMKPSTVNQVSPMDSFRDPKRSFHMISIGMIIDLRVLEVKNKNKLYI